MGLTQIGSDGIKDQAVTDPKIKDDLDYTSTLEANIINAGEIYSTGPAIGGGETKAAILDAAGVRLSATSSGACQLRFTGTTSNDYIAFKSDGSFSGTTTFVLPDGDGSANQVLKTDGSGNLDWTTITDTNTQLSTEEVQDIVGAMFTGNTETNITATYEDSDGTIDLVATASSSIGGATGVDFNDDVQVRLGTDNDLSLYHDDSQAIINNATGTLKIRSNNLQLTRADNEVHVNCVSGNQVELNYSGNKKFETYSNGTLSTGNMKCTGSVYVGNQVDGHDGNSTGQLFFGAGNDLKIYHDGSNSYIKDSGTGRLLFNVSGFRINSADNSESLITGDENGAVEIYHADSKKLDTNSNGISVYGNVGFASAGDGIDFGATANAGGGSSNRSELLDDYEEGQWAPTYTDGAGHIDFDAHRYVKIGAMVTVFGNIRTVSSGTSGTAAFYINSLPFTSANYTNVHYSGTIIGDNGWDEDLSDSNLVCQIYSNQSVIRFWKNSGQSVGNITLNNIGNSANLMYSISYMAA